MMRRSLSISFILASFVAGGTLRAATKPRAGSTPEANGTWTSEDLQRLNNVPGLIFCSRSTIDRNLAECRRACTAFSNRRSQLVCGAGCLSERPA